MLLYSLRIFSIICICVAANKSTSACQPFVYNSEYKTADGPGLICENKHYIFDNNKRKIYSLDYSGDIYANCFRPNVSEYFFIFDEGSMKLDRQTLILDDVKRKKTYECRVTTSNETINSYKKLLQTRMSQNKI